MTDQNNDQMQVQTNITMPFTMVQNEVMDSMSFEKPIDKLVYVALLRFAFGKGSAFPSIPKIALMCSSTLNTIRDAIKRLVKMGLVKMDERKNGNGTSSSNLYTIFDLTPEMKANSVDNKELYEKAKEKFKKKKKENKAVDNSTSTYPSNSEGYPSNIEGYPSNSEGYPSNFEPEEEELNKKNLNNNNLNNNQSIYLSELNRMFNDKSLPIQVLQKMKFKIDRLIDLSISPIDIEIIYNDYTEHQLNDMAFSSVLADVLDSKTPIGNFKAYFKKSAKNYYKEYETGTEVEEKPLFDIDELPY